MERIPNEVFRLIFFLTVFQKSRHDGAASYNGLADSEVSEGQTWPSVFQFSKGPWAISSVCTKWRTISTTFPQLWNRFRLMASDLDPTADGTTALTTWVSFSGTSELSFFIEPDGICNDPHRSKLFELLVDHADRWEKIEFYNSTPSFWLVLHTRDVRNRLGSLTTITVHSEEANTADDALSGDRTVYQVFLDAPQLRTLINRNHLPVGGLDLPWGQLTEYEGSHRVLVDDHLQILCRTPNLEECRLAIAYVAIPSQSQAVVTAQAEKPSNTILLPNLQTLQIRTTWFSDSIQFLPASIRRLRIPALKTLHIVTEHLSSISPPYTACAEVLRSSSSDLRSLALSGGSVTGIENARAEDILDLLRATPSLRNLCITVGTSRTSRVVQDTIIPGLNISEEGSGGRDYVLLPMLETLELKLPSPSAIPMIDLTALAKAICSRSTASGSESIRNLMFFVELGDSPVDGDVLSSIIRGPINEVLKREGEEVDISIQTRNRVGLAGEG